MISEIIGLKKKVVVNADPLFLLADLLIKIDKREKVIKQEDVKEEVNGDK